MAQAKRTLPVEERALLWAHRDLVKQLRLVAVKEERNVYELTEEAISALLATRERSQTTEQADSAVAI